MADLSQISQGDQTDYVNRRGLTQQDGEGSRSKGPLTRSQSTPGDYYEYEQDDRTDDDDGEEPIFSEDEAVTQRGVRRSQSVKITRSKLRKDARYGSLRIKTKKRPALNTINYAT
ncbi:receptor expression-enhancing protein 3-like [Clupea harengus]|uniref:Receptor expression-enhancing protein 3-like n=1 Tax=Clupea harengus TaxID=7950 RepID=A0A8M1K9A7_CLUHA|nr:receptor expression-enhancing protein 3-like [Clupea harengus]